MNYKFRFGDQVVDQLSAEQKEQLTLRYVAAMPRAQIIQKSNRSPDKKETRN